MINEEILDDFMNYRNFYYIEYMVRSSILRFFLFLISMISLCNYGWGNQPLLDSLMNSRFEIGYSTGDYAFLREGYGELGLFLPLEQNESCYFADLRGYGFNHNKWGSSLGLGFRHQQNSHVLGANLYYDNRGVKQGRFNQIGIGIERLGYYLDFRMNGYLPIGNDSLSSSRFVYDLSDGFLATCRNRKFSFRGFDAEVGGRIFDMNNLRAYGGIGPYYYHGKYLGNLFGGYARFQLSWKSYISAEAVLSYDRINNIHVQGKIMISIPFEGLFNCCNDPWINLLIQPVHRNGIIQTGRYSDYTWNW